MVEPGYHAYAAQIPSHVREPSCQLGKPELSLTPVSFGQFPSRTLHGVAAACSHLVVLKLPARLLGRAAVRPVAVLHVSWRPLLHHQQMC